MKSLLNHRKIRLSFWVGLTLILCVPGIAGAKSGVYLILLLLYMAFSIFLFAIILKENRR
jgi:hypothetical protein